MKTSIFLLGLLLAGFSLIARADTLAPAQTAQPPPDFQALALQYRSQNIQLNDAVVALQVQVADLQKQVTDLQAKVAATKPAPAKK